MGGPYPPYRGAIFREEKWQPIVKYRDCLPWALQKWLILSWCHLGCWLGGSKEPCVRKRSGDRIGTLWGSWKGSSEAEWKTELRLTPPQVKRVVTCPSWERRVFIVVACCLIYVQEMLVNYSLWRGQKFLDNLVYEFTSWHAPCGLRGRK